MAGKQNGGKKNKRDPNNFSVKSQEPNGLVRFGLTLLYPGGNSREEGSVLIGGRIFPKREGEGSKLRGQSQGIEGKPSLQCLLWLEKIVKGKGIRKTEGKRIYRVARNIADET